MVSLLRGGVAGWAWSMIVGNFFFVVFVVKGWCWWTGLVLDICFV